MGANQRECYGQVYQRQGVVMSRQRGRRYFYQHCFTRSNQVRAAGFTLPEVLIVVVLAGILAAITAVSWQSFWESRLLNAAQDQTFQVMRQAQIEAHQTHSSWQASFQTLNGLVQWSVHPQDALSTQMHWEAIDSRIQIASSTTLPRLGQVYRVEFNHQGHVPPPFGRLTLQIKNGGSARRCVFVSTLLGALRKSSSCN